MARERILLGGFGSPARCQSRKTRIRPARFSQRSEFRFSRWRMAFVHDIADEKRARGYGISHLQRLDGRAKRQTPRAESAQSIQLRATGVLFHAAQKVVHGLSTHRHQRRVEVRSLLLDYRKNRRSKIMDQTA